MNKIFSKYRSLFLTTGFLVSFLLTSDTFADNQSYFDAETKACLDKIKDPAIHPTTGVATPDSKGERAATSCGLNLIYSLNKKREDCKNIDCKNQIDQFKDQTWQTFKLEDSRSETKRKEQCVETYESDEDIYKECSKLPAKTARSCAKAVTDSSGFMNSEEMQMATPMLGMVSGADTLLGIYSAMNERPDCTLSKEDFKENERKLEDQKKEIEDKVKENMKEAETAQKEYADKLTEWSKAEEEIINELEAMPRKKEDDKHKLENEKIKIKMQADSKYSQTVEQIADVRRKYNDMISAKAVALSENSAFAIHDRCSIIATGGDPAKQSNASAKPTSAVQASFAGAFAQGKTLTANIQKRYDNCLNTETLKQKRIEGTFVNELKAMQAKLVSLDQVLGQINEEMRLANEEINIQISNIERDSKGRVNELARKYQGIQAEKSRQQEQLKRELQRLDSETKKYQQQVAVLAMKLSMYAGKKPAKYSDDKSVTEMLNQCGESFRLLLENFQSECCKVDKEKKTSKALFSGKGASTCRIEFNEFDPEKLKAPKKAAK